MTLSSPKSNTIKQVSVIGPAAGSQVGITLSARSQALLGLSRQLVSGWWPGGAVRMAAPVNEQRRRARAVPGRSLNPGTNDGPVLHKMWHLSAAAGLR